MMSGCSKADGVPLTRRSIRSVGKRGSHTARMRRVLVVARFAEKSMIDIPLHGPAAGGPQPVTYQRRFETGRTPVIAIFRRRAFDPPAGQGRAGHLRYAFAQQQGGDAAG